MGEAGKGEDGASAGVGASAGLKIEAELPQGHNLASPTHTPVSLAKESELSGRRDSRKSGCGEHGAVLPREGGASSLYAEL